MLQQQVQIERREILEVVDQDASDISCAWAIRPKIVQHDHSLAGSIPDDLESHFQSATFPIRVGGSEQVRVGDRFVTATLLPIGVSLEVAFNPIDVSKDAPNKVEFLSQVGVSIQALLLSVQENFQPG